MEPNRNSTQQPAPARPRPKIVNHHRDSNDYSSHRTAGFGIRFLAILIDGVITGILGKGINFGLAKFLPFGSLPMAQQIALAVGLQMILTIAYCVYPLSAYGYTPGKKLLGLRVIHARGGSSVTFMAAFVREIPGKFLSMALFLIGYLMVLISDKKLALHDHMAGTRVVHEEAEG